MKELILAGGCFWGVEAYFKLLDGVIDTSVGYANGTTVSPTYEEVCSNNTGYAEVVKIVYDPRQISLDKLLEAYFKIIDPTSLNKQGPDTGSQYRTGIYTSDLSELPAIQLFVDSQQKNYKQAIVTEVLPLKTYVDGEIYHQDYLDKNPNGYCHIPLKQLKKELGK